MQWDPCSDCAFYRVAVRECRLVTVCASCECIWRPGVLTMHPDGTTSDEAPTRHPPDPRRPHRARTGLDELAKQRPEIEGRAIQYRERVQAEGGGAAGRQDVGHAATVFSRLSAVERYNPLHGAALRFFYLDHGEEWRLGVGTTRKRDPYVELARALAPATLRATWDASTVGKHGAGAWGRALVGCATYSFEYRDLNDPNA